MAEVLTDSIRWTVSTRSGGEVLAVRVGESGVQLGFLGCPRGLTAAEIEGWLGELIGMAAATAEPPLTGPDALPALPIPRSLHQALTGLLFLQAEVWGEPAERAPMGLVVVECCGRVALGWSGSGRVALVRSGEPAEPSWIVVRDDTGREARALVTDGDDPLSVRAVWSTTGPGGTSVEGVLEAEWPGRRVARAEEAAEPVAEEAEEAAAEAVAEPAAGEVAESERLEVEEAGQAVSEAAPAGRSRPFWHFRSWMDRLAETKARPHGPAPREREPGVEEPIAPLPPPDAEPIAHDVPGVPDLLPEPEPAPRSLPVPEAIAPEPAPRSLPLPEAIAPEPEPAPEPVLFALEPRVPEAIVPEPVPRSLPMPEWIAPEPVPEPRVPEVIAPDPEPAPEPVLFALEPPLDAGPTEAPPEPIVETDVPDGTPVGAAQPVEAAARARARRLEWPVEREPRRPLRLRWRRSWTVAAALVGLFALGWLLGHVDAPAAGRAIGSAFTAIGIGPARYEVSVTSQPAGAWIAVDGVDQALRTPATLSLKPGRHEITLSLSGEGGSSHPVSGKRGERVAVDVALWGGLRIDAPPGSVPLTVTVDGMPRGYVPLVLDRLQPGIHRLQFSGPGVAPWEQTVEVHVERTAVVLAQPVVSPPTGVLEVNARLSDESGSEPLSGAAVRIDGQHRGVTPLRLELPRGPHSVRVSYRGEDSPVHVVDLPGGNRRYATLDIGLSFDQPRLSASLPARVPRAGATVLSASLERAREGDVREMWLHARTPEGAWRRYPMSVMSAPGGLVGVVVFPTDLFGAGGRTSWYVSALAPTGDEYFTEIQTAQAAAK